MADDNASIATGYAASNAGGTGTGAVIFHEDVLGELDKTLGEIDKQQENRVKQQNYYLAQNQKFLGALNPNINGIFPGDKDAIVDKTQKLQNMGVNYLQAGRNPTAQSELNKYQEEIKGDVAASVARNKYITQASAVLEKDQGQKLDTEASHKQMALLMTAPLGEFAAHPEKYLNNLLVEKQPALGEVLDGWIKKFGKPSEDDQVVTTGQGILPGQYAVRKTSQNISNEQFDMLSNNYRTYPAIKAAADQAWGEVPEDVKVGMKKDYIDKGGMNPVQADNAAQDDYIKGQLKQRMAYKTTLSSPQDTPQEKEKLAGIRATAGAQASDEKNYLYDPVKMFADVFTGQPGADVGIVGRSLGAYKQLQLDEDGKPLRNVNTGAPVFSTVDNRIISIEHLPDGGISVRTTESSDNRAEKQYQYYLDNMAGTLKEMTKPGADIYKDFGKFVQHMEQGKEAVFNNEGKAVRSLNAVNDTGDWDADLYRASYNQKFAGKSPFADRAAQAKTSAQTESYTNQTKGKDAQGNDITIGVKNGKWYNIANGQEFK